MSPASTDLVPLAEYAIVQQDPSGVLDVMRENVGTGGLTAFDFTRVKVPAGGGTTWEVPTLSGTDDRKSLEGIIVYWREPRAWWEVAFDQSGGGTPPDCASDHGEVGRGRYGPGSDANPSGRCDTCPMSAWGTDEKGGRGQACKQMRLLCLLEPAKMLPLAVFLPPTSLGPAREYMLQLAGEQIRYCEAITRIELVRASNKDGIGYSKAQFSFGGRVEGEPLDRVRAYSASIKDLLDAVTLDAEDFAAASDTAA